LKLGISKGPHIRAKVPNTVSAISHFSERNISWFRKIYSF